MKETKNTDRFVCDNWDEPEVNVTSNGSHHAPSRKVKSRGAVSVDAPSLYERIVKSLRSGYDIKLCDGASPLARFIACVDNKGAMFVRAEAMGDFCVKTLADKKPRYVKGGRDISVDEAMAKPEAKKKDRKCQSKVDSYVTCPNCDTKIRVGRDADGGKD